MKKYYVITKNENNEFSNVTEFSRLIDAYNFAKDFFNFDAKIFLA